MTLVFVAAVKSLKNAAAKHKKGFQMEALFSATHLSSLAHS